MNGGLAIRLREFVEAMHRQGVITDEQRDGMHSEIDRLTQEEHDQMMEASRHANEVRRRRSWWRRALDP